MKWTTVPSLEELTCSWGWGKNRSNPHEMLGSQEGVGQKYTWKEVGEVQCEGFCNLRRHQDSFDEMVF